MLNAAPKADLTVSEASFVVDQSRKSLDRAIERGEIKARLTRHRVRVLDFAALRTFCVQARLGTAVTPTGRKTLQQALSRLAADQHHLVWRGVGLDLTAIDRDLARRLERLTALRAAVRENEGQPVLAGTDRPVYQIAALAAGQGVEATLEDYPDLSEDQVRTAADYARAWPKTGRPWPSRSLKRTLTAAADAGVFDVDLDGLEISPDAVE